MRKDKNPALAEHFEKLRSIIPEVYMPKENDETEKLLSLLKSSLSVIEAVYLQHPESFTTVRYDAYAKIISELKTMGHSYDGSEALIEGLLAQSILPMQRAGKGSSSDQVEKKAV